MSKFLSRQLFLWPEENVGLCTVHSRLRFDESYPSYRLKILEIKSEIL
jgi:hypothetical protein